MLLTIAAVLGFASVAIGAYSEHGLRPKVSAEVFRFLMTAVRYNQVHAVVAAAIGLTAVSASAPFSVVAVIAGWGFVLGILLFSGSIYASAILNQPQLTRVAPVGGMVLMAAWLALAWAGIDSAVS